MRRFKCIISLYLILLKGDDILVMRRKNTGYEDGNYGLPSGHLEEGESIIEGLLRETKEEAGIDLHPSELQLAHTMHRKEEDARVDFFFIAKKYNGEITNMEPEKCDDIKWVPIDLLPDNTIPYIKTAIENIRKNVIYSEVGF